MRLNQSPAQLYYINEVLGAGAFVAPVENVKEARPRFLIFVERELKSDERDFVAKMFAAIAETDYLTQVAVVDEDALAKHDINFAVCFSKPPKLARQVKWVELPSLETMLGKSTASAQMNIAKKTAWAQLKFLKQEMGS